MRTLFGTDGIRGTVGEDLTPELVRAVGRAVALAGRRGVLGTASPRPRALVGRDTRTSGPALEAAFVQGFCEGGGEALGAGVMTTPGVAYLTRSLDCDVGVVISASHNPSSDNGVKLFGRGGWKLDPHAEASISSLLDAPTSGEPGMRIDLPDALHRYLDHLTSVARSLEGLRVVVDCAHGAAAKVAPLALERLGAEVTALNAKPDGSRINDGCGALHPDVVARAACDRGAIGITFDGDADRVLFADESGRIVDGDALLALLAERLSSRGELAGNSVVATVMSNQALRRWCAERGIGLVEVPVGDRHVLEALRSRRLVLGGEQSGHIVHLSRSTTGDGILVALEVLDIVAECGGRLEEIVPFEPFPQVLVSVPAPRTAAEAPGVRMAIEGAERALAGAGRVLVRPSGTEPVVRVMVEATDAALARQLADEVAGAVRSEAG